MNQYEVFIYCGGKCGSMTLVNTFSFYNYRTLHVHGEEQFREEYGDSIFDVIDHSDYNKIYFIDSYRLPIERKISSFFENIKLHVPDYVSKTTLELISYFNENLINTIEDYHPINEIMTHDNIPTFTAMDFENRYNIVEGNNRVYIKLLFRDIHKWSSILTTIFGVDIILMNQNTTKDKDIYPVYEEFLSRYLVPVSYIDDILSEDAEFKIYNTEQEQEEYIQKWRYLSKTN